MANGQPDVPVRPFPRWVALTLAGIVLAALGCGAAALVLGKAVRDNEAEQSLRRVVAAVSTTQVVSDVPMELPDLRGPTEVPPLAESAALEANGEVVSATVPVLAASPQPAEVTPLAVVAQPGQPRWQAHAVSVSIPTGAPRLALVLDDMGGIMETSRRAVETMPAGVTLSFFPWSREGVDLAKQARHEGHEIMIHMPMEALPHGGTILDPGPGTLKVGMEPAEIENLLLANLISLKDIAVGMNNHMGSRFTEWQPGMRTVLTVLQREGMLFVDSKTAAPTSVKAAAEGLALPVLTRDVFLDHEPNPTEVRAELARAVALARKRGYALAIGHPLPVTLDVLATELPAIVSSGVVLVPVTALVQP